MEKLLSLQFLNDAALETAMCCYALLTVLFHRMAPMTASLHIRNIRYIGNIRSLEKEQNV